MWRWSMEAGWDRWEDVRWDDWMAFRELEGIVRFRRERGIHHLPWDLHDDGVTVTDHPAKDLIEPDGRIGRANCAGLTREERADYDVLM